jgi:hypothetical protein
LFSTFTSFVVWRDSHCSGSQGTVFSSAAMLRAETPCLGVGLSELSNNRRQAGVEPTQPAEEDY